MFEDLTETINQDTGRSLSWAEVADGFLQVANSAMYGPVRSLTEARGHHTAGHQLASFGGAGGQHACAIAEALGIRRVTIHKYASILSAYGIGLADVVHEEERPCAKTHDAQNIPAFLRGLDSLSDELQGHCSMQTFNAVDAHRFLNVRYDGSETAIMIALEDGLDAGEAFVNAHHQQFGFTPINRKLFVDTIRVRAIGRQVSPYGSKMASTAAPTKILLLSTSPAARPGPSSVRQVYFSSLGWAATPVHLFASITAGMVIRGPALVVDKTQTLLVGPSSTTHIVGDKLVMDVSPPQSHNISTAVLDPMGRVLQNVSVSANIKERLDFSCAIFTPDCSLVANAPHVPAMIGSMAFAVKSQIKNWAGRLRDGDVILSNSPAYGGTHLPNLTIVTPVGSILPGSMPLNAKFLWEEGAMFDSFLLVRNGMFVEKKLHHLLYNVTDLKAQVAVNHTGIRLVRQLIEEYTMDVVQMYMGAIQDSAELAIRNLFKNSRRQDPGPRAAPRNRPHGRPGPRIELQRDPSAPPRDPPSSTFRGRGRRSTATGTAPRGKSAVRRLIYARPLHGGLGTYPLNHGCIRPDTPRRPSPLTPSCGPAPATPRCARGMC
ncbi:Hydantoinase B/oxoprolinase-domain-containing protein [Diaporthe sp. PMI_573]|nr:Hydantoinase B/oxoprolinase-domain-containing protein [Diaporthaceae sp. PMI_573]